ncbi:MAG: ABC transporter permease [bacterium]
MKKRIYYFLEEIGGMSLFLPQIIIQIFKPPFRPKYIIHQLVEIGINTLPIVGLMSLFVGMVLAYLAYLQFKLVEFEMYTGSLVGASMVMELGPVLTAIIVAGRIGAATTAEIGSMKVTEQIDALYTLAVNPIKYLAAPRFLAAIIMLPLLTIFADIIGMFGGYMIGVWQFGIQHSIYINKTLDFLAPDDIICGLIKTMFFGAMIVLVSCYKGFTTYGGAEGVGKATTSAVVISIVLILVMDYFLTIVLF